jgi:hypothetical protein
MKPHLEEGNGQQWYVGGACYDRSEVDEENIPTCLAWNEIVAALFRPNAVVRGRDGRKLTAPQVRDHIKSGKLKFISSFSGSYTTNCHPLTTNATSGGMGSTSYFYFLSRPSSEQRPAGPEKRIE